MVKILGALMTGIACGYFGFRMRMTLKTRAANLALIRSSLETLEGEIHFGKNRLKKAFERADHNGLFTLAAENIEKMGAREAWSDAVNKTADKLCLTDADREAILLLGQNIGRTDCEDQIKNIRYVKSLVAAQYEQAEGEYQKRARLYSGGGMLIGALLVIILI